MSTYTPGIPNATDLISNSQAQIKTNFTQLNTQFGVDHVAFNTGSSNGDGHHKQVTFDNAPSAPSPTGTVSVVYPQLVSSKQELYFANATVATQMTSSALVASNGEGFIPGGLQVRSGQANWPGQSGFINFSTAFPTACVSVVVCNANSGNNAATINVIATAANRFQVFSPNVSGGAHLAYIATGY